MAGVGAIGFSFPAVLKVRPQEPKFERERFPAPWPIASDSEGRDHAGHVIVSPVCVQLGSRANW
jgi:hypothetical protein